MRMPWLTWVWPIIILLSTLAVALITFWFPGVGIRPVVIMCFLFIIPGMTIVRFFRTGETFVEWMFAIALSFTLDAFVAGIILYARHWSPLYIMDVLLGFCFSGAIAQLIIIRPAPKFAAYLSSEFEDTPTIDLTLSRSSEANNIPSIASAEPLSSEEDTETTIILKKIKSTEDTEKQTAVLLPHQEILQKDVQDQPFPLNKPELLGKEA